jgi:predicted permease
MRKTGQGASMNFVTSLINVGLLIALAMPGYILGRLKLAKGDAIDTLVNILLYAACPFLSIMSFARTEFSSTLLVNMGSVVRVQLLFRGV